MEATLTFFLPENQYELSIATKAQEYVTCLNDIYTICREIWKYEENVPQDKLRFAEKIAELVIETDVLDL